MAVSLYFLTGSAQVFLRCWEDRSSNNNLSEIPIPVSQMQAHHVELTKLHYSQQHPEQGLFSAVTEKHPHLFCAIM